MRVQIRRIGVFSAAKVGFLIGMTVGCAPVLLYTYGLGWIMYRLYEIVDTLRFLQLVSEDQFDLITQWGQESNWWLYVVLFVVGTLFVGLAVAVLSAAAAVLYNLISQWVDGLQVELSELDTAELPQAFGQPMAVAPAAGIAPAASAQEMQPPAWRQAQPWEENQPPTWQPSRQAPGNVQPPAWQQPLPAAGSPLDVPIAPQRAAQIHAQSAAQEGPRPAQPVAFPSSGGPCLVDQANPNPRYPLDRSPFILSSTPGSQVYDPSLLPRHAEIRYDTNLNAFLLYDHSGGQVWVNERPVQNVNKLINGFRVRVGTRQFVFFA